VSTVFLPLTVTTGFFGMNFGWLTDHIGSLQAFVIFGLAVPALSVLTSLALVRRYGA
jgi:magnesium transporter